MVSCCFYYYYLCVFLFLGFWNFDAGKNAVSEVLGFIVARGRSPGPWPSTRRLWLFRGGPRVRAALGLGSAHEEILRWVQRTDIRLWALFVRVPGRWLSTRVEIAVAQLLL